MTAKKTEKNKLDPSVTRLIAVSERVLGTSIAVIEMWAAVQGLDAEHIARCMPKTLGVVAELRAAIAEAKEHHT